MLMICKACGAQLGEGDTVCPQCGTEVTPAKGGVGFWDMLSKPADIELKPVEGPANSAVLGVPEQLEPSGLSPKVKRIVGALGAAAAGGLLALSIMTLNTVQSTYTQMQTDNLTMQQRIDTLETAVNGISDETGKTWELVGEVMVVVSEPLDTSAAAGVTGDEGEALFTMRVAGEPTSFAWERNVDGIWQPVAFDEKTAVNKDLGLKLVERADEGVSSLAAAELTSAAAGEYRCVVTDAQGNTVGRSATLSVVEADGAEAATPADGEQG